LPPVAGHILVETIVPPHQAEGSRYTLTRMHAEGGLGRVWLARDGDLHRGVALKEIRPERAANPETWRRFLKEAQITGQLEHPNIVPVYELARRREDDQPFYVMRFVHGQSLRDAIASFHRDRAGKRSDPLGLQSLLGAFLKVCDAVAYAHARGVVHRDLKPENVVLGGFGEVIVLDWGLAKLIDQPEEPEAVDAAETIQRHISVSPEARTDKTEGLFGTPCYMAPEQVELRHEEVDGRTDVYALGGILFEILTGHPPVEAASTAQVLEQVRAGRVPGARQLEPTVPRALESVCAKALARNRLARYAGARDLAAEVRRWIADEPVLAHRESLLARGRRWMRHHRTLTTAAAVVVLAALAALGFAYRREQLANAQIRAAKAESDRRLDQTLQAIEDYYTGVSQEVLLGRQEFQDLRAQLLKRPQEFYEQLTRDLKSDGDVRGRSLMAKGRLNLGHILWLLGQLKDARRECEAAMKLYQRLGEDNPDDHGYLNGLAKSYNDLGNVLHDSGDHQGALESCQRVIAIRSRLVAARPSDPEYQDELAKSYNNLGNAQSELGNRSAATESYQQSIEIRDRLVSAHPDVAEYHDGLANSLTNLGVVQNELGERKAAITSYQRAIEIRSKLVSSQPVLTDYQAGLANSYNDLGVALHADGDLRGATESHRKAAEIRSRLVALRPNVLDLQSDLAKSHSNLGTLLGEAGDLKQASRSFGEAIAILSRLVVSQPENPDYAHSLGTSLLNLGILNMLMNEPKLAEEAFRRAIQTETKLADSHPRVNDYTSLLGHALDALGEVLLGQNRDTEAESAYNQAVARQRRAVESAPNMQLYRERLSSHYAGLGRASRRLRRLEQAVAAAHERRGLNEHDAVELYGSACDLSLCVPIARTDQQAELADQSVRALRAAVSAGWSDVARTSQDPGLLPLRGRPGFEQLLAELFDRTFPDDPFARP
jgi:serine/threonine-protein kinase